MAERIKVKNRKTGVISYFNPKKWEDVQKKAMFNGAFIVVTPSVPKEVKELEEKKKAQQAQPKKGTSMDKTEEVK